MAPRKGESARERASRQAQQSSLTIMKADEALVIAVMHECPSSIRLLRDHLQLSGYISDSGEITKQEVPLPKATKRPMECDSPQAPVWDGEDPIPCTSPLQASSEFLSWLLGGIDDSKFSWSAIRGMRTKGQRKVPAKMLVELLEFVCGLQPEMMWNSLGNCGALRATLRDKRAK